VQRSGTDGKEAADIEPIKPLAAEGLSEAFERSEKTRAYFRENDPNMEQTLIVIRDLGKDLNCYRMLYSERKRAQVQRVIGSFFSPKARKLDGQLDSSVFTQVYIRICTQCFIVSLILNIKC
jgi:hypothetical protein